MAFIKPILKYYGLFENIIIQFKKEKKKGKDGSYQTYAKKLNESIKIQIISFIIVITILSLVLQYYLINFCDIYKYSQIILMKDSFISFAISFIYPLILVIIPVVLRRYSLLSKNRKNHL